MFPRTIHCEVIAVLELAEQKKISKPKTKIVYEDDDDDEIKELEELVRKYGTPDPKPHKK